MKANLMIWTKAITALFIIFFTTQPSAAEVPLYSKEQIAIEPSLAIAEDFIVLSIPLTLLY
jgi:hypothetical protein